MMSSTTEENTVENIFGMCKDVKKNTQQIKNELRSELY